MDYEDFGRGILEINLGVLAQNIKVAKSLVSADVSIMAAVKANAYGHGILSFAHGAVAAGVDWLGVATVDEGAILRKGKISHPVLVMGALFAGDFQKLAGLDLSVTVFGFEVAQRLSESGGGRVHIKVDTGMNRIGFQVNDDNAAEAACREILRISKLPNIYIEGIFSHFASSDTDPGFTDVQFRRFNNLVRRLEDAGLNIPIKHISNSGGVLNHPECNLNMVRLGVLLYGLAPDSTTQGAEKLAKMGILPILALKSRIVHIKIIVAMESVGYNRNFYAGKPTKIATIPLGYGDGVSRQLSNRGFVQIHGKLCPIVGNVCMDQFMVDATGLDIAVGDEVTLIGEGVSAEQVAQWQGSINYEVVTALSGRIQRNYKYTQF
ncbi:MAG: alanine racemase [Defluviitaleaceae bacterium]|nr:alanine racemase [Defluviitaleaceae bacterium]